MLKLYWCLVVSIQFVSIFSEELAQRLQAEENRAAHQAQEQNERVRGNQSLIPSNNPVQPTASSSSRQVERHESQRNKNVSDEYNSVWYVIMKKISYTDTIISVYVTITLFQCTIL